MSLSARAAVSVTAAALAIVLTSCGGGASPPSAAPASSTPPTPTAAAPTTTRPTPPPGPPTCEGSIDADTGESSVTGSGAGRMSTSDAGLFIGCGSGPELRMQIARGSSVVVTLLGRVRPGRPATVGPYRVEVLSLQGSAARFRITTAP